MSTPSLDRLPPFSNEAEQGVLGCLLLDPVRCVPACVDALHGKEPFYDLRHQEIYKAIVGMWSDEEAVDLVTLQQRLRDRHKMDRIGGLAYLSSLMDVVPSPMNLEHYLDIVKAKATLRSLIRAATEIVQKAFESQDDPESQVSAAESAILAVRSVKGAQDVPTRQIVCEAIAQIEASWQNKGTISGLSTGLIDLDKMTDGLHPGELTIIAAFPSTGKSSLAMNIVEHVVLEQNQPAGVFSLEMTSVELMKRMIASNSRVNLRNIKEGLLTERDFPRLTTAASKLSSAKAYFDDTGGLSIFEVRARARRMRQEHGVKLIVVDYIQLLNANGGPRRVENRQTEVADISNGLKNMAKELNVPVIALSQLNDDGKLKSARAIGEDGDCVWKLSRLPGEEDDESRDAYGVNLFISKQRNGPRNVTINLTFLPQFTRFESAAKVSGDDVPYRPPNKDH